jgi:hypothetical protein
MRLWTFRLEARPRGSLPRAGAFLRLAFEPSARPQGLLDAFGF